MKIDQGTDNGNIAVINRYEHLPNVQLNNRSWLLSSSIQSDNQYRTDNIQYNVHSNFNNHETVESHEVFENDTVTSSSNIKDSESRALKEVCNQQYRIYTQNNLNVITNSILQQSSNLAESVVSAIVHREIFKGVFLTKLKKFLVIASLVIPSFNKFVLPFIFHSLLHESK